MHDLRMSDIPEGYEVEINPEIPEGAKRQLPPLPDAILPWTDEQKQLFMPSSATSGRPDELLVGIGRKLSNLWLIYAEIRNNEAIHQSINDPAPGRIEKLVTIRDKHELRGEVKKLCSELFMLQSNMVNLIDVFGKVLGATDLAGELDFLAGMGQIQPN